MTRTCTRMRADRCCEQANTRPSSRSRWRRRMQQWPPPRPACLRRSPRSARGRAALDTRPIGATRTHHWRTSHRWQLPLPQPATTALDPPRLPRLSRVWQFRLRRSGRLEPPPLPRWLQQLPLPPPLRRRPQLLPRPSFQLPTSNYCVVVWARRRRHCPSGHARALRASPPTRRLRPSPTTQNTLVLWRSRPHHAFPLMQPAPRPRHPHGLQPRLRPLLLCSLLRTGSPSPAKLRSARAA